MLYILSSAYPKRIFGLSRRFKDLALENKTQKKITRYFNVERFFSALSKIRRLKEPSGQRNCSQKSPSSEFGPTRANLKTTFTVLSFG